MVRVLGDAPAVKLLLVVRPGRERDLQAALRGGTLAHPELVPAGYDARVAPLALLGQRPHATWTGPAPYGLAAARAAHAEDETAYLLTPVRVRGETIEADVVVSVDKLLMVEVDEKAHATRDGETEATRDLCVALHRPPAATPMHWPDQPRPGAASTWTCSPALARPPWCCGSTPTRRGSCGTSPPCSASSRARQQRAASTARADGRRVLHAGPGRLDVGGLRQLPMRRL